MFEFSCFFVINLSFEMVCQVLDFSNKILKLRLWLLFLLIKVTAKNCKTSVLTLKCVFFLKLHPQQSPISSKL